MLSAYVRMANVSLTACSFYDPGITHTFPGQDFSLRLAVVGSAFDGVVPGAIRAFFNHSYNATLGLLQSTQTSDKPYCKNLSYSINSTQKNDSVTFKLHSEHTFF